MKNFFVLQILLLAVVAMASSQVNVVDNPGPGQVKIVDSPDQVHVVEQPLNQVDPGFYRPSAGGSGNVGQNPPVPYPIIPNPDPGFYQPSNPEAPSINPGFVVDPGFYRPSDPNAPLDPNYIIDGGFYRPSDPNAPILDPNFVDPGFYQPSNPNAPPQLDIVDPGFYLPSVPQRPDIGPTFVINNPDPGFGRPSANNQGSIDPGFGRPSAGGQGNVQYQNKPYPPKQYDNAFARGGK